MNRIIKIGMDVHTTNYTLCIFEPSFEHDGTVHCITQVKPEIKKIIHVIETFKKKHENEELNIVCGYEAGCCSRCGRKYTFSDATGQNHGYSI